MDLASKSDLSYHFILTPIAVEDIEEEDLYRYTRYRWMWVQAAPRRPLSPEIDQTIVRFNETQELSTRHLKFNLRCLLDAAVQAVGNGATSCSTHSPSTPSQYLS